MKRFELKEIIREEYQKINEVKPGRAWEGKIKKIDKLMAWMYDKDILNAGEKKEKDVIFRQYYRYYNDGDTPRGLPSGYSSTDEALEAKLENFIKTILSKYLKKIDRKSFRYDKALSALNTVLSTIQDDDFYGFYDYWIKTIPAKGTKLAGIAKKIKVDYDKLRKLMPKGYDNTGAKYARESLKKTKKWTKEMESPFKKMQAMMADAEEIVSNMISATKKMQKLHKITNENVNKIKMSKVKEIIREEIQKLNEKSNWEYFYLKNGKLVDENGHEVNKKFPKFKSVDDAENYLEKNDIRGNVVGDWKDK